MPSAYPSFEFRDFVIGQSIRLGDDGDKVDFGMKPAHKLNIERLQPIGHRRYEHIYGVNERHLRVPSWLDEVQTSMDAIIRDFLPVDAVFLLQIRVKPGFNVLDNGFPAVTKYICVRGDGE